MSRLFPPQSYVHLQLTRVGNQAPRRKRPGGGRLPDVKPSVRGPELTAAVQGVLASRASRYRPSGIDPQLVLRVQLAQGSYVDVQEWQRSGFVVLGSEPDNVVLLFSSDEALTEFRRRIDEYSRAPAEREANPPYRWLSAVTDVREWGPYDRRGRTLQRVGLPQEGEVTLDVELWYPGSRERSNELVTQLRSLISDRHGTLLDAYYGQAILLVRVRLPFEALDDMLSWDMVYEVQFPPKPQFSLTQVASARLDNYYPIEQPVADSPGVCIIDSGVQSSHGLLAPAFGEGIAVPNSLGIVADVNGHGTMVAGLALYGDVQQCISQRSFRPKHRIFSARVTNEVNEFDDFEIVDRQMQDVIEYFHTTYNCRVFNISLGDANRPFDGRHASSWAATLDALARRLDIVIVVSAGNYWYEVDDDAPREAPLIDYPKYLFDDEARILSPAEAANVLTVGALARTGAPFFSEGHAADPSYQVLARENEPSSFTRTGPGVNGAIKPELVEIGGSYSIDARTGFINKLDTGVSCVSLNRNFAGDSPSEPRGLFRFGNGTSFAAPRVAFAAACVLEKFSSASANMVRALLASSASVPEAARKLLKEDESQLSRICGYGRPDIALALESTDERVVLISDSKIDENQFHIYEVPIPDVFASTPGQRFITVTLAYDPPSRHTRVDYLGTSMDFQLIREMDLHSLFQACSPKPPPPATPTIIPDRAKCSMFPSLQARQGSTLQRAVHRMVRNPDHGDTYYVVVRNYETWAGPEFYPQRYALVVTLEHAVPGVQLYAAVRVRARAIEQARVRLRGHESL